MLKGIGVVALVEPKASKAVNSAAVSGATSSHGTGVLNGLSLSTNVTTGSWQVFRAT